MCRREDYVAVPVHSIVGVLKRLSPTSETKEKPGYFDNEWVHNSGLPSPWGSKPSLIERKKILASSYFAHSAGGVKYTDCTSAEG